MSRPTPREESVITHRLLVDVQGSCIPNDQSQRQPGRLSAGKPAVVRWPSGTALSRNREQEADAGNDFSGFGKRGVEPKKPHTKSTQCILSSTRPSKKE